MTDRSISKQPMTLGRLIVETAKGVDKERVLTQQEAQELHQQLATIWQEVKSKAVPDETLDHSKPAIPLTSKEQAPTHEYSPESGWQVFCPRCHCEIKTLKTAPHSEHECILALLAKVQAWEKSCTGKHGSQQPCVSGDSSAPETSLRPGELEQLCRIDRTARAYVDAPPGPEAGKAYDALQEALFDGCPSAVGSARTSATSGVTSD